MQEVKQFIEEGLRLFPDSELMYETENFYYINLESVEASIYYSQHEKEGLEKAGRPQYVWCTANPNIDENMFYHYKKTFLLVFVQDKYDLYGTEVILIDTHDPGKYLYVTYDNQTFRLTEDNNEEYIEAASAIEEMLLGVSEWLEESLINNSSNSLFKVVGFDGRKVNKESVMSKILTREMLLEARKELLASGPESEWVFYLHEYGDDKDEEVEEVDSIVGTLQDAISNCKSLISEYTDGKEDLKVELNDDKSAGACYYTCYGDSRDNAYSDADEFLENNPDSEGYSEFCYQVTFEKVEAAKDTLNLEARNIAYDNTGNPKQIDEAKKDFKVAKTKWHGGNVNGKFTQARKLRKESINLSNPEDVEFVLEELAKHIGGELTSFSPVSHEVWAIKCPDRRAAVRCVEIAKEEKLGPTSSVSMGGEIVVYFPTLIKSSQEQIDENKRRKSVREAYENFMARKEKKKLNEAVGIFLLPIIEGLAIGAGLFLITLIVVIWNLVNKGKDDMKLKSAKDFKELSEEEQKEVITTVKENATDEVVTDAITKLLKTKPNWVSGKADGKLVSLIKKAFKKLMDAKLIDIAKVDISKKAESEED